MAIDKNYCMSSYLAFRYIEREDADFFEGLHHRNFRPVPAEKRIAVDSADEIDAAIRQQFKNLPSGKKGILLSGGMDSAICASYMRGAEAYTFRFLDGAFQQEELQRAEYYARQNSMTLHYVDISWQTVEQYVDRVMEKKCAPVHSIEPQILQAALQAKEDGVTLMVVGESSDLVFGGMDGLLSEDWTVDAFAARYTFTDPAVVLKEPADIRYLYERYRIDETYIDYLRFMDDVFSVESSGSYYNAFQVAEMPYFDPYASLIMKSPLDLKRVRNGESKYLIRDLMKQKYPDIPVPEKVPMPRPVDLYFSDWAGPARPEFLPHPDMRRFSGNQKWQLWCLERFLNLHD